MKINNKELEKAIASLHKNKTAETQNAVTRAIVGATFLLPVLPVKGQLPEDFPAKFLKNEKGMTCLPLFTAPERAQNKTLSELSEALIPADISDAYAYILDAPEVSCIVINPFSSPNLTFDRTMVENLAKLWSRVKTAELNGEDPETAFRPAPQNIRLTVPASYDDAVIAAVNDALGGTDAVSRAWLCIVQLAEAQGEGHWMMILDTAEDLQTLNDVLEPLGKKLSALLGVGNISMAVLDVSLKEFSEQATPIYLLSLERESKQREL